MSLYDWIDNLHWENEDGLSNDIGNLVFKTLEAIRWSWEQMTLISILIVIMILVMFMLAFPQFVNMKKKCSRAHQRGFQRGLQEGYERRKEEEGRK